MTDSPAQSDIGHDTGTPRWVKVQGVFVVLLIMLVIGMSSGAINPGLFGLPGEGHGASDDAPASHTPPKGGH